MFFFSFMLSCLLYCSALKYSFVCFKNSYISLKQDKYIFRKLKFFIKTRQICLKLDFPTIFYGHFLKSVLSNNFIDVEFS